MKQGPSLEAHIFAQLVKKSLHIYETGRSFTVFTKASHWTLSWTR
jgi:hypothetical protein